MNLDDPVHYRNLRADVVHGDVACPQRLLRRQGEEEEVAALERGLHGPGEDDDDGRFRVGEERDALPEHERRGHDADKVERLQQGYPNPEAGGGMARAVE